MLGGFNYWLLFKHTKGWLFEMTRTFFGIGGSITNQLNPILYHHHPLWSTVSQSHCIAIRPPSYPHKFVGSIMNVPHQTQEIPIKCRKMFWWTRKKNVSRDSRDRDLCTKNRRWRRRSCGRWVVCCSSSSVLADRGEWVVNGLMDDCLMDGQWFKGWFKGEWQSYKLWMEEAIYSMI